jgi:hypothetical protein
MSAKKNPTQKERDAIKEYSDILSDAVANGDECACIPVKTAITVEKFLTPILF